MWKNQINVKQFPDRVDWSIQASVSSYPFKTNNKGVYNLRTKSIKHSENLEEKISNPKSLCQRLRILEAELERLKLKAGMGLEINLEWSPGIVRHKKGKRLLEEVSGDTIFIYLKDLDEAMPLLTHAFLEWLLNQNTKRYRLLINKLIEVFEQIHYDQKEKIIEAIAKLICYG